MSRTYSDTATKSPIFNNWFAAMAGNKQNYLITTEYKIFNTQPQPVQLKVKISVYRDVPTDNGLKA